MEHATLTHDRMTSWLRRILFFQTCFSPWKPLTAAASSLITLFCKESTVDRSGTGFEFHRAIFARTMAASSVLLRVSNHLGLSTIKLQPNSYQVNIPIAATCLSTNTKDGVRIKKNQQKYGHRNRRCQMSPIRNQVGQKTQKHLPNTPERNGSTKGSPRRCQKLRQMNKIYHECSLNIYNQQKTCNSCK